MPSLSRLFACVAFLSLAFLRLGAEPVSTGYFEAIQKGPAPEIGHEYYLRHCIRFERGVYKTTNYGRGTLLPINAKVKLVAKDETMLVLHVIDTGETVKVENQMEHSRANIETIARRLLAPKPISLDEFDKATAAAIRSGILQLGMTREQVVMARGYPLADKTPDLDLNTWVYQSNLFVHQTIVFSDGVLTRGRGID